MPKDKNFIICNGEKHYPLDYSRMLLAEAVDAHDNTKKLGKDMCVVLEAKTLDGKLVKFMLRPCDGTHMMFDLLYLLTTGDVLCKDCAEEHWVQVREALVGLMKAKREGDRDRDQPHERN